MSHPRQCTERSIENEKPLFTTNARTTQKLFLKHSILYGTFKQLTFFEKKLKGVENAN